MSDFDLPSPWLFRNWFIALILAFVALIAVGTVVGGAGNVFGIFVNRKAVEQSIQYSTTNTEEFYANLASIKKIDVQVIALPLGDPQRVALESQRDFLRGECRRAVAKIPADSRTPDMIPYSSGGSL